MARRRRRRKKLSVKAVVIAIIFLIVILVGYFIYEKFINKGEPLYVKIELLLKGEENPDDGKQPTVIEAKGAISFHFMMLGNDNAGDCTYIKAGDNDILIDAGSRTNSIDDIKKYVDQYVTDGKLEYVIATHADQDHIAGFSDRDGSIFDLYECETIIDFALRHSFYRCQ